ncbi:MAG: alpha/beta hydrolase [Pigmentiphaga sp.]|uniref:alpha/beta fold hydrolase n=1 Tax=Pigmentiphaga sp. TaxID=1977564 RepID=UPI0029B74990|nr:alpha/beta hydrolase [Pigmentiphaga sp.]MDX3904783.1 alpha/beta hydrolase [Pigmentiphaga sp.]
MARRNYVLVHGAWHGGWCWRHVAGRLREAGHAVFTPTLTGLGERRHLLHEGITLDTFVQDIANVLQSEELRDVYLVGHSFGGRVACGVADRLRACLRRLVLLDAGLPEPGKAAWDALPADVREARLADVRAAGQGGAIPPPPAQAFGVADPHAAAWLARRLTPHPLGAYTTPLQLSNPLGNGLPVTYIRCTAPAYGPIADSAAQARARTDWQYLELATAHDAMVTAPDALARMLLELD